MTVLWTVHSLSFARQSKLNLKPAAWRETVNTKSGVALSMPSLPTVYTLKLDSICNPPNITGVSFLPHGSVLIASRAWVSIIENRKGRAEALWKPGSTTEHQKFISLFIFIIISFLNSDKHSQYTCSSKETILKVLFYLCYISLSIHINKWRMNKIQEFERDRMGD